MKRILTALTAGFFIATAACAQMPNAPLPNAPAVNHYLTNVQTSQPIISGSDTIPSRQSVSLPSDDISLYTVVDLALRNSKAVLVAEADQRRARSAWSETHDAYIPNFAIGSGLGYSYGFPLGTPTIFNVTSNSLLLSFSQRDYIRSARAAFKAATLSLKNIRQRVILDAALNYIELNKTTAQIAALNQANGDADKLLAVMQDRLNAGLESKLDLTQTQLTQAQIQLQQIQLEDHADELRQHLAGLTGLTPSAIVPAASSIPPLPDLDFHSLMQQAANTPGVQAANATADSKMFRAWGDKRQNYRPTVQLAAQYALFSTFNNYAQYYQPTSFQQNNFGIGIQAIWPLFDPLRRDQAVESEAEAVRARRQAELTLIQSSESNLALWHSLKELEAEARVADLEQQIAQATLASAVTQMNQGSVAPNGAPATPQETDAQRIKERTSFVDLQNAQFNVTRVKLDLLNAVGGLEDWAKEGPQTTGQSDKIYPHVIRPK